MRIAFALIAIVLLSGSSAASAEEWCSVEPNQHSRMDCGFTSREACVKAVDNKGGGFCEPDPDIARLVTPNVKVAQIHPQPRK